MFHISLYLRTGFPSINIFDIYFFVVGGCPLQCRTAPWPLLVDVHSTPSVTTITTVCRYHQMPQGAKSPGLRTHALEQCLHFIFEVYIFYVYNHRVYNFFIYYQFKYFIHYHTMAVLYSYLTEMPYNMVF